MWHRPTATPRWQEKCPLQWHLPSPAGAGEVEAAAGAARAWGLKVWLGQKRGGEGEALWCQGNSILHGN